VQDIKILKSKNITKNTKKGFGLIEVMVSALLFVLTWLILAGNIYIGKACEVRSRHYIQAIYYAQSYIEEVLRKVPFDTIINMYTTPDCTSVTIGAENPAKQFNATRYVNVNSITYTSAPEPGGGSTWPMYADVTITIEWYELPIAWASGGHDMYIDTIRSTPLYRRGIRQRSYIRTIIPNDPMGN